MIEPTYQTQICQSFPSILNQSAPFTLFYEAQRDMSMKEIIQIRSQNEEIIFEQQQINMNLSQGTQNASVNTSDYHLDYFSPRSHLQIRNSYMSKLMDRGIITTKPKLKYRHLFVFDWDDTLLCTTYLNHFKFSDLREKDHMMLGTIDDHVCKILNQSLKKGDVSIITNAAKGWVQYSSNKFLPKTCTFIAQTKIPIISARSQYGQEFPNQIKKWKVSAFQKLISVENSHLITNIICVGDSTIQMEAGQVLASSFEKSLLKTVKFRQNPRIQQLIKQQQLLARKLEQIVNTAKNLTIRLQRKASSTKLQSS